jgi:hypothetical protein
VSVAFVAMMMMMMMMKARGRVGGLDNRCYFPADSVVLTCCVMVGRDGLFVEDCVDGMTGWDDGI